MLECFLHFLGRTSPKIGHFSYVKMKVYDSLQHKLNNKTPWWFFFFFLESYSNSIEQGIHSCRNQIIYI